MATLFLLSCEHAGNEVPAPYAHLFKGEEEVLYSHKGMDFGAMDLAQHLSQELNWPLYSTFISRLLVEANRSLDHEELFSNYSKKLPKKDKEQILAQYYFPHRNEVEAKLAVELGAWHKVYHLAIHTFTPATEGEVRPAGLGILFDPKRPLEKEFAAKFKAQLHVARKDLKVLYNSPYPGVDDGLPTYLRQKFNQEKYAGFELEINQKFFLDGRPGVWEAIKQQITTALKATVKDL